jgi:hypothetical protein
MPQAGSGRWLAATHAYRAATGRSYFTELLAAYRALGLIVLDGRATAFASLTPVKEREVVLLAPGSAWRGPAGSPEADVSYLAIAEQCGYLIAAYRTLGVAAFDLALFGPPLDDDSPEWDDFPVVARLVDRGDPLSTTADVAAMELFGSSVVAHDPFLLAHDLAAALRA